MTTTTIEDTRPDLRSYLTQVYGILTGALAITMATVFASMNLGTLEPITYKTKQLMAPPAIAFVFHHPVITVLGYFATFFILLAVLRNVKAGVVGLGLFSVALGTLMGPAIFVANLATNTGGLFHSGHPIRDALALTLLTFGGLSAYVLKTGEDFSAWGGFLFTALWIAILVSLGVAFFGGALAHMVLSGLLILLFFGFVLYDTSNLIHGDRENPVEDAVSLYLDMTNLFVNFLTLLKGGDLVVEKRIKSFFPVLGVFLFGGLDRGIRFHNPLLGYLIVVLL